MRRHRSPFACRGMIGHRWTWVPEVRSSSRNVVSGTPASLLCLRCDDTRALGILVDMRAALRAWVTFTDDPTLPPLTADPDARFGLGGPTP